MKMAIGQPHATTSMNSSMTVLMKTDTAIVHTAGRPPKKQNNKKTNNENKTTHHP